MDGLINNIVELWGPMGIVIGLMIYIVIEHKKSKKHRDSNLDKTEGFIDNIKDRLNNIVGYMNNIEGKIENITENFNDKINMIEQQVKTLPHEYINIIKQHESEIQLHHNKQLEDIILLGPRLHDILKHYVSSSNADHIFIGSFHNGNSSLSGIPYYKFDIIAERYGSKKNSRDCEFSFMYKDSDILRFGSLPSLLIQNNQLYFEVPESEDCEMMEYDDIIWRRMRGRGIKKIGLRLLKDSSNKPSGFVGIICYDENKELNMNELHRCGIELEQTYHSAESHKCEYK